MSGMASTQRSITAHHEAGHAAASVMRGGSTFRSVDLTNADGGHGLTLFRAKATDHPFIAYAGPWAEARLQWPAGVALDGEDDDGMTFDDYVDGALLTQPDDRQELQPHDDHVAQLRALGVDVEPYAVWLIELEAAWPAVQSIAARLLDGDVLTDTDVRAHVEANQT